MKYEVNYPVAFHTVDIAIMRIDGLKRQVLLAQKVSATEKEKDMWRFPGGFVEPKHDSAEHAAVMEVDEETKVQIEPKLEYIGSTKIKDPRYLESPHKIITSFFEASWKSGSDGEGPFDDVARTKWFNIDELTAENMNPIHAPLFNMLLSKYKIEIKTNEVLKHVEETMDKFGENVTKTIDEVSKGFDKVIDGVKEIFKNDK